MKTLMKTSVDSKKGLVQIRDPEGNSYKTFDIHQHISYDGALDDGDLHARLGFMDRFGITQSCLLAPARRAPGHSVEENNDRLASYRKRQPERFPVAVGTIDLRAAEAAQMDQLDQLFALGLRGVVWHHLLEGEFLDSTATARTIAACKERQLNVFLHVVAGSLTEGVWRLHNLCELFPDTTIVALDGLSAPDHGLAMISLAHDHENLVLDTGVLSSFGNLVERFVEVNGDDRLMLGTDFCATPKGFSFPYALAEILYSGLSPVSKAKILFDNARRLFDENT
jgi:predicted TIM-barrel fold metal-dependent hydrolase